MKRTIEMYIEELTDLEQVVIDLEYDLATSRILFAKYIAEGDEVNAQRMDCKVRNKIDDLNFYYGKIQMATQKRIGA